jgi:hypothetical protein
MKYFVQSTLLAHDKPDIIAGVSKGCAIGTILSVEEIVYANTNMWIRSGSSWYPVKIDGYIYGYVA